MKNEQGTQSKSTPDKDNSQKRERSGVAEMVMLLASGGRTKKVTEKQAYEEDQPVCGEGCLMMKDNRAKR